MKTPDLQKAVEYFGGFDKIDWNAWDKRVDEWQVNAQAQLAADKVQSQAVAARMNEIFPGWSRS